MAPVITSRDDLLDLIAAAGHGPAEHVEATPTRGLVAAAPTLPPLRLPKLTDRVLNGQRVRDLIAAGPSAVLVHSAVGVRVVDLASIADDPDVVVIADHHEVAPGGHLADLAPLTAAQHILDRELLAITKAAA